MRALRFCVVLRRKFLEARDSQGVPTAPLTDETATKVLVKMVKQRKESAEIYTRQAAP